MTQNLSPVHVGITVVRKIKRGVCVERWPAYLQSTDAFGLWLYSPAGSLYRGESADGMVELEVGQGSGQAGVPVVQLIPTRAWWMASWWEAPEGRSISIDICTPPILVDGEWTYVDLELDTMRFADGRVATLDEDEFAESCRRWLITPLEETKARAAAKELARLLEQEVEPFGAVGWRYLDRALGSALPAITRLE